MTRKLSLTLAVLAVAMPLCIGGKIADARGFGGGFHGGGFGGRGFGGFDRGFSGGRDFYRGFGFYGGYRGFSPGYYGHGYYPYCYYCYY